uniref:complement C3-like n=1 Tax=Epinephelus lanceolatus TaxID=310571 RepID=UPI001444AB52
LKCPALSRRKRATTIMDVTTSLASQYEDQLQRECCLDGMRETPIPYTCERRSEYINDGTACVEAFLRCCKEMEIQRAEMKEDSLRLARTEEEDSYLDSNEIVSRTNFPESWLWSDITLPPCPDSKPNCDTTSVTKSVPLQDSITTWQFTGISLSRTLGVDTAEVTLGENLKISLNLKRPASTEKDITALVLSRGQLVKHYRYKTKGQMLISMIVTITKNMLPSFRIIAYYHTDENEVVSDSVWVDAEDSCMGSLKLEPAERKTTYMPRKIFNLKVTGDPGATVGLVAVDKGVYVLNNKHRLNQKKVWEMVETYDTGCTPGGGKDGMSVFYDAGLLFESNTASGTPHREDLNCPALSRRKRATTIMDVTTSLASQYEDQLQRECCLDGMRETPIPYTCERRSEYINDGTACVEAFLRCCKEMEIQRAEMKEDSLRLARTEEEDSYLDSNEIVSRTNFPESWLWSDITLPPCPDSKPNCDTTSVTKSVPLQDSITTWQFTGISLSRTLGICVAEPLEIIVRKNFFIDLRLPYSAVRGEQLEIKAVIHNYNPNISTVSLNHS